MRWLYACLLAAATADAGCSTRLVDPCAGVGGTCLGLQLEGTGKIDGARVRVRGGTLDVQKDTATPDGRPAELPVALGIELGGALGGNAEITVEVTGLLSSAEVSRGSEMVRVSDGQRLAVRVVLKPVVSEPPPSCSDYCAKNTAACTGANAQYATRGDCENHCKNAEWPKGTIDDGIGNTTACRSYHSTLALESPVFHCPHAGLTGGDVCGGWCENYCYLAQRVCTGAAQLFADGPTCLVACAAFPSDALSSATTGNSVQCRINALGQALTEPGAAPVHCQRASPGGGGVCG